MQHRIWCEPILPQPYLCKTPITVHCFSVCEYMCVCVRACMLSRPRVVHSNTCSCFHNGPRLRFIFKKKRWSNRQLKANFSFLYFSRLKEKKKTRLKTENTKTLSSRDFLRTLSIKVSIKLFFFYWLFQFFKSKHLLNVILIRPVIMKSQSTQIELRLQTVLSTQKITHGWL